MDKSKALKILIIAGFCTIILTPLSLAVMWFFTDWKKKTKIILSAAAAFLYAVTIAIVLFLVMDPQSNQNSGRYTSGSEITFSEGGGGSGLLPSDSGKGSGKKSKDKKSEQGSGSSSSSSSAENNFRRIIIPIIFVIIIIILVAIQNLRSKKKIVYENPYVDTKKYILPLAPDFKFPMVHFSRLELGDDEKILFVTESTQPNNEGDFVITNKRCVLLTANDGLEIPLEALQSASSISSSVIQLSTVEEKYYSFMPESQVKYALAVLKWLNK
ncbi:MAG: hypothetical protein K5829_00835 [Treponema sp.]|nr:hypothetical protein [Treponema sp.]